MNKEELLQKFKLKLNNGNEEPKYVVNLTMDENDADYKTCSQVFTVKQWNDLPLVVLLCLSYCAKGSNESQHGKFKGKTWNDYCYGHFIVENEDFPWIVDLMSEYGMIEYGFDGYCHSYESIEITYYDDNCVKHDVEIPDFDELFKDCTKEQMIDTMNAAYAEYEEQMN